MKLFKLEHCSFLNTDISRTAMKKSKNVLPAEAIYRATAFLSKDCELSDQSLILLVA